MAKNKVLVMGGVIIDKYILVDKYPDRGQDTIIKKSFERVGGCALNVANTLKNLGLNASIVSAIGDDSNGKQIKQYLKNQGFDLNCIKNLEGEKSGFCITVLEEKGERTFLTYKGCEGFFEPGMVKDDLIYEIAYVYLTGYFLMNKAYYPHILETLDKVKLYNGKIVFDPGPLVKYIDTEMLVSILKRADILVPNEVELVKMQNRIKMGKDFTKGAFDNKVITIVKMGSRGVRVFAQSKEIFIPSFKVKSIDTTGAGDSFAGGLIYSLINNYEVTEAVQFASACGAITTTFSGPHGKFDISDIKQLIRKERR